MQPLREKIVTLREKKHAPTRGRKQHSVSRSTNFSTEAGYLVIKMGYWRKRGGTDGRWQFSREHVNVLRLTDYSFLVVSDIRYQFSRELDADWHENE